MGGVRDIVVGFGNALAIFAPALNQAFGCVHAAKNIAGIGVIGRIIIHIYLVALVRNHIEDAYDLHIHFRGVILRVVNACQGVPNLQPVPLSQFPADNNATRHIIGDVGAFHQLKPARQKQLMVLGIVGAVVVEAVILMGQFLTLIIEDTGQGNQGGVIPRNAIYCGNLLDHVLGHKFLCAVIAVPAARRDVALHGKAGPGGSPDFLGLFFLCIGNRQPGKHQGGNGQEQEEHQQRLFPLSCAV